MPFRPASFPILDRHMFGFNIRSTPRLASLAISFAVLVLPHAVHAQATSEVPAPTLSAVFETLKSGDLDTAMKQAIELDDANARLSDVDTTLLLMQVARGFSKRGDKKAAADLCARALSASERTAASSLTEKQHALIRLAAGSTLFQADEFANATEALAPALSTNSLGESLLSEQQQSVAAKLLIQIGNDSLRQKKIELASKAYSFATKTSNDSLRATAMLGHGWALASEGTSHPQAAKVLNEFVDLHPDHTDAARAAVVCVHCWLKSYRNDKADALAEKVFREWPNAPETIDLAHNYISLPEGRLPKSAKDWLQSRTKDNNIQTLDPAIAAFAIIEESKADNHVAVDLLADRLAVADTTGEIVTVLLSKLDDAEKREGVKNFEDTGQADTSTQLVTKWMDGQTDSTTEVREAACRWAADNKRWSMLALASKSHKPAETTSNRSVAVERFFAESLTQTGQSVEAQVWLEHLVEVRHVSDFATLLRYAEAATANSDVATAVERVEVAKLAATTGAQRAMAQMLEAELSIRKLEFDAAREILSATWPAT